MFRLFFFTVFLVCFILLSNKVFGFQIETYNPSGYIISANTDNSTLKLSLILNQLEQNIAHAIENGKDTKGKLTLHKNKFIFKNDKTKFELSIDADFNFSGQKARCEVNVNFYIPKSQLTNLILREAGSTVSCHSGALIPVVPRLIEQIAQQQINDTIRNSINQIDQIDKCKNDSKEKGCDWIKEDPEWTEFMHSAYVQGRYCSTRGYESLCLYVAWTDRDAISKRFAKLSDNAPKKTSVADLSFSLKEKDRFLSFATEHLLKNSHNTQNLKFPSGCRNNNISACNADDPANWDDGDMALFGGLICISGEELGCVILKNAQDSNGQFWRSPDVIGEKIEDSERATFSGDQFKGVIAYFLTKNNKEEFEKFLKFILSKRVDYVVDHGYKSCDNTQDKEDTCLLGGQEWFWLNFLAKKYNLIDLIPEDHRNPEVRFGYSRNVDKLLASLAPIGYRAHLVAVEQLLAKKAGIGNETNAEIAAVLAGRQQKNPFYLYLHLTNDILIQNELKEKCSTEPREQNYTGWTWQYAELTENWKKKSMVWDCVFMHNLILGN